MVQFINSSIKMMTVTERTIDAKGEFKWKACNRWSFGRVSQPNNARTSYVVALSLVVNNGLTDACKKLLLSFRDKETKQNTSLCWYLSIQTAQWGEVTMILGRVEAEERLYNKFPIAMSRRIGSSMLHTWTKLVAPSRTEGNRMPGDVRRNVRPYIIE